MAKINLRRDQIARFIGSDPAAIRAFEQLLTEVNDTAPQSVLDVTAIAESALSAAAATLQALAVAVSSAEAAENAAAIALCATSAAQDLPDQIPSLTIPPEQASDAAPYSQQWQAVYEAIEQVQNLASAALARVPVRVDEFVITNADPTTNNIPNGQYALYKNTTSGLLKLWANDGGTLKSVTLT